MAEAPSGQSAPWRVYYWLRENRQPIVLAESRFGIDRRAIAGVIAYESLIDIHPLFIKPFARYSGPGKVHFKDGRLFEGEPVAKIIEEKGYLPRLSLNQRRQFLASSHGAILYIAAIMKAYSDQARAFNININCKPELLATFYSSWRFYHSEQFFATHPRRLRANDVGKWLSLEKSFLTNAVGAPTPRVCDKAPSSKRGVVPRSMRSI